MKKVEELVFEPMGLISGPVLTVMFDGLPRVKGPRPPHPPHTKTTFPTVWWTGSIIVGPDHRFAYAMG